jgi:hypothetical protein
MNTFIYFLCKCAVFVFLICSYKPTFAQVSFEDSLEYGNYQYKYALNQLPKQKNRYNLAIHISGDSTPNQLVYQSQVRIEGTLAKGKQYKIFILYAQKINDQWKIDPTSHIEIVFDLGDNLMKHSNRGMIAKMQAEQLTDVLDIDLARDSINTSKAVNYALQFAILNYNKVFGTYSIDTSKKKIVQKISRTTIFISANDATSSLRDTLSFGGKNYAYQLTETKPNYHSLLIKWVTRGADVINEQIVYDSQVKIEDRINDKGIYQIKVFYAKGKDYTWRVSPQSFTQTDFNFRNREVRWQVSGKLKEYQVGEFAATTKFADRYLYTQKDMVGEVVRFFIENFNKAFLK